LDVNKNLVKNKIKHLSLGLTKSTENLKNAKTERDNYATQRLKMIKSPNQVNPLNPKSNKLDKMSHLKYNKTNVKAHKNSKFVNYKGSTIKIIKPQIELQKKDTKKFIANNSRDEIDLINIKLAKEAENSKDCLNKLNSVMDNCIRYKNELHQINLLRECSTKNTSCKNISAFKHPKFEKIRAIDSVHSYRSLQFSHSPDNDSNRKESHIQEVVKTNAEYRNSVKILDINNYRTNSFNSSNISSLNTD